MIIIMIGPRLKQLRREKRLSQEQLGMELNLSQATISSYETGDRIPDIGVINIICDYFNVSMDYLSGRCKTKQYPAQPLTEEETNHLYLYKKLSLLQREKVNAYMQGMLDTANIYGKTS